MTHPSKGRQSVAASITSVRESLKFSDADIGTVLGANERTVRCWEALEEVPDEKQRATLRTVEELRRLLELAFKSRKEAHIWLQSSVNVFGGLTPKAMICSGEARRVLDVLATIESGAFL